jgi:hypothetical protein
VTIIAPEQPVGSSTMPGGRRQRIAEQFHRATAATPKQFTVAVAVSLLLTVAWVLIMPLIDYRISGGDTKTYMAMAWDPKGVHWAPLAFRVLEPWLAYAIGGPNHILGAFRLISWGSVFLSAPAVYLICRRIGGVHAAGILAVVGALCLPMTLFLVHQPYLVDSLAIALMSWSTVALINGWFVALPILLTLTGLARETVLGFALPMYMWLRQRWVDFGAGWQVLFFIAPALVTVWAIRQPMTFTGYASTPGLMVSGFRDYVMHDVGPNPHWWIFYGIAGSLGMWWLLGIQGRKHGGRLWWMLVPLFAQWLFGSDYARYAYYAFPVVLSAGAIAVWAHHRRSILLGLIALQSVAVFADNYINGHPRIYILQPSTWISAGLMILTAIVLWWPARKTKTDVEVASPAMMPEVERV